MSARDDFGSNSGTSRGYGGASPSGRAGGLGNGGVGGGMGGGFAGGGAGRNGGIGSRTGLGTGNLMYGTQFSGRPGGPAMQSGAWGVRATPAIGQGPLAGRTRKGAVTAVPAAIAGVNPVPEYVQQPPTSYMFSGLPKMLDNLVDYPTQLANFRDGTFANEYLNTYRDGWNHPNPFDTMSNPGPYNVASSPGYDAYTSVYKTGPASPNNPPTGSTYNQNWPGGSYPGLNLGGPSGATGYGR